MKKKKLKRSAILAIIIGIIILISIIIFILIKVLDTGSKKYYSEQAIKVI